MISVIVPVYNVEPYLRECIDSILAQTYTDFELILVDDGSPDKCGEICDEYAAKDSRIRVIHQENGGLSAARNAGLDIAQGEYVTFVDSDDFVAPNYLAVLYQMIDKTGADVSTCDYTSDFSTRYVTDEADYVVLAGTDACAQPYLYNGEIKINACGKIYSRYLWQNVRFPLGKIHEDQAVVPIVLYKAKKVAASRVQIYYYRIAEGSIMHKPFSLKRYDDVEAIDKCIVFFAERGESDIVQLAKEQRKKIMAIYSIQARQAGIYDQIPKEYRITEIAALKYLYKNLPDERYTYYLAKIHPNWIRPHEYLRKIKKVLHIPCK